MNHEPIVTLRELSATYSAAECLDKAAAAGAVTAADMLKALGVKDPADLLKKYPDGSLLGASLADLKAALGARLGRVVYCALNLGGKVKTAQAGIYLKPRDIWEELRDVREHMKEHFVVFFLDTRNQEIRREVVSIGTLNYSLVHPREVFEPAVKNLAASIIVAHNHPSGSLEPSDEDLSLTKRLSQAGRLLGIELLDHVIVTKEGFMSFKQKGLL